MGNRVTILEDGLQYLLNQCPNIVLNARSIKLIIDSGDFNQVIAECDCAVGLEDVGNESTSDGTLAKIIKIAKNPKKKKQA